MGERQRGVVHRGGNFPYRVSRVAQEAGRDAEGALKVMRRYDVLRLLYVQQGRIQVRTLESSQEVCAGQGIFINRDVIHLVEAGEGCCYSSFMFPEYFLGFYEGSPAGRVVEELLGATGFAAYVFDSANPGHGKALGCLQRLAAMENDGSGGYAYEVLVLLTTMWLEMYKNVPVPLRCPPQKRNAVSMRMQKFLIFIERHYREEVSLEELAASAGVSKSECLRCFKNSLDTTPYKYLMDYRLSKAAELLQNSDRQISEIAIMTGFEQASYFGKCFREKLGCTPREYRGR